MLYIVVTFGKQYCRDSEEIALLSGEECNWFWTHQEAFGKSTPTQNCFLSDDKTEIPVHHMMSPCAAGMHHIRYFFLIK